MIPKHSRLMHIFSFLFLISHVQESHSAEPVSIAIVATAYFFSLASMRYYNNQQTSNLKVAQKPLIIESNSVKTIDPTITIVEPKIKVTQCFPTIEMPKSCDAQLSIEKPLQSTMTQPISKVEPIVISSQSVIKNAPLSVYSNAEILAVVDKDVAGLVGLMGAYYRYRQRRISEITSTSPIVTPTSVKKIDQTTVIIKPKIEVKQCFLPMEMQRLVDAQPVVKKLFPFIMDQPVPKIKPLIILSQPDGAIENARHGTHHNAEIIAIAAPELVGLAGGAALGLAGRALLDGVVAQGASSDSQGTGVQVGVDPLGLCRFIYDVYKVLIGDKKTNSLKTDNTHKETEDKKTELQRVRFTDEEICAQQEARSKQLQEKLKAETDKQSALDEKQFEELKAENKKRGIKLKGPYYMDSKWTIEAYREHLDAGRDPNETLDVCKTKTSKNHSQLNGRNNNDSTNSKGYSGNGGPKKDDDRRKIPDAIKGAKELADDISEKSRQQMLEEARSLTNKEARELVREKLPGYVEKKPPFDTHGKNAF